MVSDTRIAPLLSRLGGLYRDPNRVDRDASALLKSSVGQYLQPSISSLVENDGQVSQTLCLKGTISIHFRGQEYQQLMDIYLPPGYPVRPPICYVRLASPTMYLKENHPHVGSDGQVYLPYLHEWRPHNHTLIELVVATSSVFSADPPVFTRSTPAPAATTASSFTTNNSVTASMSSGAAGAATVSSSYNSSSYNSSTYSDVEADLQEQLALEQSCLEAEALEAARLEEQRQAEARAKQEEWDMKNFSSTKEKVRRKIYSTLVQQSTSTQEQIQQSMVDTQRLALSKERLEQQFKELQETKKLLEEQHVIVDTALDQIQNVCREAKEEADKGEEISIDNRVVPISVVDRQMLELAAQNASYSDVLYFLDKALHNKVLDLHSHLKQVRQVSKEQFLVRALLLKIAKSRSGK